MPSLYSSTNVPMFCRHETFHPRYGWLKKGFDKASTEHTIFAREDAHIILGVGKNMAKAIRYWCFAFKVLDEAEDALGRSHQMVPSEFGVKLLGDKGWDPYLEDPGSLWLLQWSLLKPPCRATAWYFTFNEFNQLIFTAEDLFSALKEFKERLFPSSKVADSSLRKDVNCILRMYVRHNNLRGPSEDSLDCPFADLGLLQDYGDTKHYSFNMGSKYELPAEIIVVCCLDFISRIESSAKTISISRLLYDIGSPGHVFKLSDPSLREAIDKVSTDFPDISLSETAGLIQFSFKRPPSLLVEQVLTKYYRKRK
ncbi:MAG: DUF4007 family protein [candidate division Zixibacteria bacterium]|nr:DUF4007 family protein [candidate division Zixibacteria bacterium]